MTAATHWAQIVFVEHGNRRGDAVLNALKPETLKTPGNANVAISRVAGGLLLCFQAHTIPGLRALVNSYLRWLSMIDQVLDFLEGSGDASGVVARPTACGPE